MWTLFQTEEFGMGGKMIAKAGVIADDVDHAYFRLNMWEDGIVWTSKTHEPWSASIGDILMSPNGIAHEVMSVGFRIVPRMNGIRLHGNQLVSNNS